MKKATVTSTELSVGEQFSPYDTLTVLKQELKGLKAITETQYKTSGVVEGFTVNIQSETKIENLIRMHSSLFGRQEQYNKSQQRIGAAVGGDFSAPLFKVSGHTPEDFESDVVLRIKVLSFEERRKELETLIKEGEGFLTKEDQFRAYQQKVARFGTSTDGK